jgi:cytochrome b involved in lipid metabolism
MTNQRLLLTVILSLIFVAGFIGVIIKSEAQPSRAVVDTEKNVNGSYTLDDISQHNSQTSCWAAINQKVYDLTTWIPQHPGGEKAILSLCGTDATAKFAAQHGGMSGPNEQLANFEIGALTSSN